MRLGILVLTHRVDAHAHRRRKEKRDALTATAAGNSDVDTGEQVGADAVYLEDLDKPASPLKTIRKDALRDCLLYTSPSPRDS